MSRIATTVIGVVLGLICSCPGSMSQTPSWRQNAPTNFNPPITPAWAFGHIIWEDNVNTTKGATDLVEAYLQRGLPVDGIIIDSPWSTSYCDFTWDLDRYADPSGLIDWMHSRDIKVILWTTGNVNEECRDTPRQKGDTYDEMQSLGYGVNDSAPYRWWKGYGMHLDFTNPDAVEWWYKQMDKVFVDGVYGWKVDQGEDYLGQTVQTSKGIISKKAFAKYYYDSMFDYAVSRKPEGITIARPYSHQGGFAASVSKMNLGWCGDFSGDWRGLKQQINNIYISSQAGYAAVATEVGGFYGKAASGEQLVRYSQFGSMTACMINGGENGAFTAHLPWYHGEEEAKAYAFSLSLHEQLRPYMFSTVVDAHISGGTLVRDCSFEEESHKVGENIFTKAITSEGGKAVFHLPFEGEWVDFWTEEVYLPGTSIEKTYSIYEFPLFFKRGSITPLFVEDETTGIGNASMKGTVTLLIYPNGKTTQVFHLPIGDGIEYSNCSVSYDERKGKLEIKSDIERTYSVIIKGSKTKTRTLSGKEIKIKI